MRSIDVNEVLRVMEWYDTISEGYDELYMDEQLAKYEVIFNKLRDIGDLERVLDVGCGTGLLLDFIIKRGLNIKYYVCLDISSKIIALALRRLKNFKEVIGDVIVADLTYPPLRIGKAFKLVAIITVLKDNYVVNNIIADYIKLVKEGGALIYTILSKNCKDLGYPQELFKYESIHVERRGGDLYFT